MEIMLGISCRGKLIYLPHLGIASTPAEEIKVMQNHGRISTPLTASYFYQTLNFAVIFLYLAAYHTKPGLNHFLEVPKIRFHDGNTLPKNTL